MKASAGDVAAFARFADVTFVETVLWGRDLMETERLVAAFGAYDDVIVHVPFSRPGGGDVDVCHADPDVREASFSVWEATLRLARAMAATKVVLHPGGLAPREILGTEEHGIRRAAALERLEDALERLARDHDLSEVLLENMPTMGRDSEGDPVAYLIGNAPVDLMAWRDLVGGFCLDLSHAAMTPGGMATIKQMFSRLGASIRHLHVADGAPPDDEGLPIGEGIVDWGVVRTSAGDLDTRLDGGLTAVSEVRDGHKDGGAGFRDELAGMARLFLGNAGSARHDA